MCGKVNVVYRLVAIFAFAVAQGMHPLSIYLHYICHFCASYDLLSFFHYWVSSCFF